MKSWLTRSLATVILVLVTSMGLVAPASATPRATLKAAATAVAFETVGGSNYAKYKAKYPTSLNWGNDGCSVPNKVLVAGGLGVVIKAYGKVFEHSCDRHDFGYRNFGKNTTTPGTHPKFSPTRATKDKIDSRFYSNMKVQCDKKYGGIIKAPLRAACKAAAKTFYTAVSHFADDAFFG
jgi:phospholipase A2-like protein